MRQLTKKQRRILILLLFLYLALVFYVTCFGVRMENVSDGSPRYNLKPFKEILRFWNRRNIVGTRSMLLNIFGNVVMFMPLGMFVCAVPKKANILICIIISAFFSLLIETIQFCFQLGCFDVDDLILNTTGGVLGYILFAIFRGLVRLAHREKNANV